MRLSFPDAASRFPHAARLLADEPLPLVTFGMACSVGASTCVDRGRAHRDSQGVSATTERPERAIEAGTWIDGGR